MNSLNGKRVLVTGAGGFIGSHLAERLVKDGASVRAMVHYNALNSRGWLEASECRDDLEIVAGDITDAESVRGLVAGVDVVFHLAALIAIPYSYVAPRSYLRTNVEGTLNVLEAARAVDVERVIHTSTSEVYGTAKYAPIDEGHPLQGQSPYSASKIGADKIVEAYHRSYGTPVVTVRPFNTFGPRQSTRAVIPTIITQLLRGPTVQLGALTPTRDLNFVDNTVDGFVAAAVADGAIGRTVNLGTGREISIEALARSIAQLMGTPIELVVDSSRDRPVASEVERLIASAELARDLLSWSPTVGLEDGLRRTIAFFSARVGDHRGYVI